MLNDADRLRRLAAVAGFVELVAFILVFVVLPARELALALQWVGLVQTFYIWRRVDGRPDSRFGRSTTEQIALGILSVLLIPSGTAVLALSWLLAIVANGVSVVRSRLLVDLGRGDPALPRLTATFRMNALYLGSLVVMALTTAGSVPKTMAALVAIACLAWQRSWEGVVSWRLLRETGPSIRVGLGPTEPAPPVRTPV